MSNRGVERNLEMNFTLLRLFGVQHNLESDFSGMWSPLMNTEMKHQWKKQSDVNKFDNLKSHGLQSVAKHRFENYYYYLFFFHKVLYGSREEDGRWCKAWNLC